MINRSLRAAAWLGVLSAVALPVPAQQKEMVRVDLAYRAPGSGPKPDFSPKGTQVRLVDWPAARELPEGAVRPARAGTVQVGPDPKSWMSILVTAESSHPQDLCRLYVDRNRNGNFNDDGPPLTSDPALREKTKAWWSSFPAIEMSVPYGADVVEPYMVNFWAVREGDTAPDVIRFSVNSWRSGAVNVEGIDALVAVMDSNNHAVFDRDAYWSVLAASGTDAARRVLSIREARTTNRLMFLEKTSGGELVLQFRSITPDGRSLNFAVIDRPVTKAQDRAPDDTLAPERVRPRASQPFHWMDGNFESALAQAKQSNRKLIIDYWTSWCGPCKTMDDWIWTDAEVAGLLNAGYVGVKLDGDLEKELVARFNVKGYPTIVVLDPAGKEIHRFNFVSSKDLLPILKP